MTAAFQYVGMAAPAVAVCLLLSPACAPRESNTQNRNSTKTAAADASADANAARAIAKAFDPLLQLSPPRFEVINVRQEDVLNLRSSPDSDGQIVRTLKPSTSGLVGTGAVVRAGRTLWRQVLYDDASGWVNDRFLKTTTRGEPPANLLLTCFGNEPFWSLDIRRTGTAVCGASCPVNGVLDASLIENKPGAWRLVATKAGNKAVEGTISRTGSCSDGMSDFTYDFDVSVSLNNQAFKGCCRFRLP